MSLGEQLIDVVYIDDVVEAYLTAAKRLQNGLVCEHECYAVSSGQPIKLRELVKTYEQIIGKKLHIEWGGRPYRPREVMVPWNKGKKLPGWQPKYTLEQGIKEMLDKVR